jgi:hypothetical protein
MRSSIIAVFLALSAASVTAQCVAQAPTAPRGGELIASAVAATHDDIVVMRPFPIRPKPASAMFGDDKDDHRTGGAMLLAAVALMSGIALRRLRAPRQ